MADAKVNIVGNSDDAQRAVDKLRAQFEKMEEKLKNQAKFSKQAKSAAVDGFNQQVEAAKGLVMQLVSVQAGWQLASSAIRNYMDENRKLQDMRDKVAPSSRETEIKLINQGTLNGQETATTMGNINKVSEAIPVGTVHDSKRITEEMFSQGFDRQEVINGDTLRAFLELKAATNQFGEGAIDSKELVKSVATSLRNTEGRDPGQAISAQEIEKFGKAFQSLFLTQSIQLQDAIPFARIQSILTARGIDEKTLLAAFSVAVDAFGSGDVAATYLQQATAYMGRAGSEKMKNKLDKLGIELDATKFDLIGEDLVEALRNMGTQINALDPRQKADALDALFGTKAQAGALTLMGKADNIEVSRNKISDADGDAYGQAVEKFRLSDQAQAQAIATRADVSQIEGFKGNNANLTFADVDNIIAATREAIAKDPGASAVGFSLNKTAADLRYAAGLKQQSPKEYLDSLQSFARVGDAANQRSADLLDSEIKKADPQTAQMAVLLDRQPDKEKPAGEMELLPKKNGLTPVRDRENNLTPAELEFTNALDSYTSDKSQENLKKFNSAADAIRDEMPAGADFESHTTDIYRRQAERQAGIDGSGSAETGTPAANANSSETMNVKDADLHASVKELNTTMSRVADILSSGPDKQRVIRLPSRASAGTA